MVPVFTKTEEFLEFFAARAPSAAIRARLCSLAECDPVWKIGPDGVYRPDGLYYRGDGVYAEGNREVPAWHAFMISQDSGNKVGLVIDFSSGLLLMRVKGEAGNLGYKLPDGVNSRVLLAPSVQFTQSNLERHYAARRGENDPAGQAFQPVPLADLLDKSAISNAVWESVPADGGRFFEKRDEIGVLFYESRTAPDAEVLKVREAGDFAWLSREVVEAAREKKLLSHYSYLALSVLDYANRHI